MQDGATNPRVTWLMPVKNGMPFLPETLASIEAQTYRNWEVLIWDNASADGTVQELRNWVPARLPGRIVTDRPMPFGDSLAALVSEAGTELCARIDADDVSFPDRLAKQVAFMGANPRVGLLGTNWEWIDEKSNRREHQWWFRVEDSELRWRMRWETCLPHAAVIFRRSVVLRAGNYRNCWPQDDFDLFLRMAVTAEVRNLPEVLVKIRQHAANWTAGVRDYTPLFDRAAADNASLLFGNMDPAAALDIRKKVADVWNSQCKVTLRDLRALHTAALSAARSAGKPPGYFQSTELYRLQRNSIVRRILMRNPLGAAILRWKRLAQRSIGA
jgi:glycosyl transferase family 2